MKIIDVIQGSPEWFAARCGIPTSSNFHKIITSKGAPSEQRKKYLYQLAGERILGIIEESYQSQDMIRGKDREEEACQYYELITGRTIEKIGFCLADDHGASPDRLVEKDGLLEVKCRTLSVHVEHLLKNVLPASCVQQIQGQLMVTGRKWCDYLSYFPAIKPLLIRVNRDEKFIKALTIELELFCKQLDEITDKIK